MLLLILILTLTGTLTLVLGWAWLDSGTDFFSGPVGGVILILGLPLMLLPDQDAAVRWPLVSGAGILGLISTATVLHLMRRMRRPDGAGGPVAD